MQGVMQSQYSRYYIFTNPRCGNTGHTIWFAGLSVSAPSQAVLSNLFCFCQRSSVFPEYCSALICANIITQYFFCYYSLSYRIKRQNDSSSSSSSRQCNTKQTPLFRINNKRITPFLRLILTRRSLAYACSIGTHYTVSWGFPLTWLSMCTLSMKKKTNTQLP